MMRKTSFLVLLCTIPLYAFATSKVEVGTSIQVVDVHGNTEVRATESIKRIPTEHREVFAIPQTCMMWISTEHSIKKLSVSIPKEHPLYTRIESQMSSLHSFVQDLRFAPYLSSAQDASLRTHLLSNHILLATSSEIVDCLYDLEASMQSSATNDQRALITRISNILVGIRYGIQRVMRENTLLPSTKEDALYAADLLRAEYPHITSLSIAEDRSDMMFLLPVKLLGRWRTTAVVHMTLGETLEIDAPWWITLGSHRLSEMTSEIQMLPSTEKGVAGMFLRAEQVGKIISP